MITIPQIIEMTANTLGHDPQELVSDAKGAMLARHVAMYLCRVATPASLMVIGAHFNRDHTSIYYVVTKVAEMIEGDERMAALVAQLQASIRTRRALQAARSIDVLALSARILSDPSRQTYRTSVDEIAALALATRDFWDIATTGEALTAAIAEGDSQLIAALSVAIAEAMDELRGGAPDDTTQTPTEQKEAS